MQLAKHVPPCDSEQGDQAERYSASRSSEAYTTITSELHEHGQPG